MGFTSRLRRSPRRLRADNVRVTFKSLVTGKHGLNYCCVWAFFKLHKRTGLIAARLGLTDRAVRYNKARFKSGEFACEKCEKCLKGKLL